MRASCWVRCWCRTTAQEEAVPHIRKAIGMRPDVPQYYVNLGTAYSRMRDLDAAADCYRRALLLQPQDFDAQKNLGSVLLKAHRFADAVPALRQALDSNPLSHDVRVQLGLALHKTGQDEEAVSHFEFVLARGPTHCNAPAGLGQALMNSPNPAELAVSCWRKLIELEPDNPAMHNNLATILKNAKQSPEAEAACRRHLPRAEAGLFSGAVQPGHGLGRHRPFRGKVGLLARSGGR